MHRRTVSAIAIFMMFVMICWSADNPIVGRWVCTTNDGAGTDLAWTLVVKQDGDKLAGSLIAVGRGHEELRLIEPKLDGNMFTFKIYVNDNCTVETKLKVEGDKFEGTFACSEVPNGTMKGTKQS